jgi:hypothetical protein
METQQAPAENIEVRASSGWIAQAAGEEAPVIHNDVLDKDNEVADKDNEIAAVTNKSGLDDPFKIREGRDLVWKNINMTVAAHGHEPEKKILANVWGEVPKRQVTAVMGPSGSGSKSAYSNNECMYDTGKYC